MKIGTPTCSCPFWTLHCLTLSVVSSVVLFLRYRRTTSRTCRSQLYSCCSNFLFIGVVSACIFADVISMRGQHMIVGVTIGNAYLIWEQDNTSKRHHENTTFHNQLIEALLNCPLEEEDNRQSSQQGVDHTAIGCDKKRCQNGDCIAGRRGQKRRQFGNELDPNNDPKRVRRSQTRTKCQACDISFCNGCWDQQHASIP